MPAKLSLFRRGSARVQTTPTGNALQIRAAPTPKFYEPARHATPMRLFNLSPFNPFNQRRDSSLARELRAHPTQKNTFFLSTTHTQLSTAALYTPFTLKGPRFATLLI